MKAPELYFHGAKKREYEIEYSEFIKTRAVKTLVSKR